MPQAVTRTAFGSSGQYLYVVGGSDDSGNNGLAAVRRLDMATGTWATGPALGTGRFDGSLVITNAALYAVSGQQVAGGARTPTVERLALSSWPSGSWTSFPSLPEATMMGGQWCATSGSNALVGSVGGYSGPDWYSSATGVHWRTTITGETCAR
jgi:hypothetical protein